MECTAPTGWAETHSATCSSSAGGPVRPPPSTPRAWTAPPPKVDDAEVDRLSAEALEPFNRSQGENPYSLQYELQDTMQHNLVGIIRVKAELEEAIEKLGRLRERAQNVSVEGHRQFNPGWHLALDLDSLLTVSEAVARCALLREESRGGHTRDDFPATSTYWAKINNTVHRSGEGETSITQEPLPEMPDDLKALFEEPAK